LLIGEWPPGATVHFDTTGGRWPGHPYWICLSKNTIIGSGSAMPP
jgi:hypothetical protein